MPIALEQVPTHAARGAGERVEPVRREIGVEEKGQEQLERFRLAAAVLTAQDQPAVVEAQLVIVVLPEVENARAQRLKTHLGGHGRLGSGR
ncbi:MAG: hypothetical protein HC897_13170 [Thermoanaerobaculia bacterium]|nr:hypothetical protein [Thermoanaerobaculia bacterium]